MSLFGHTFQRECKHLLRRPIYLVMVLVLPLFCYAFFASMLHNGLPVQLPVAVVDHDNSILSRSIIRQMGASQQIRIASHLQSYSQGRDAMQRGELFGFIILPGNMQADAIAGRCPEVAFYTNNSYLVAGSLVMRDLTAITTLSSAALNLQRRAATGQPPVEIAANIQPITLNFHAPGNPYTNYSLFLSSILSHGMLLILILLTSVYTVGIEIKKGTTAQWLESAGGSLIKALTGKLLPYTLLFSLMVIAGNTLFFKYLHFPCQGSFFAMQLAGVLMVIAYQTLGIFILGLLGDFKIALTIAGVYGVMGLSFSGLTFPIEIMDTPLQGFSWIFPLRYYFGIQQAVAFRGLSAFEILPLYLLLAAFVLFPLIVIWRVKRMINV